MTKINCIVCNSRSNLDTFRELICCAGCAMDVTKPEIRR